MTMMIEEILRKMKIAIGWSGRKRKYKSRAIVKCFLQKKT